MRSYYAQFDDGGRRCHTGPFDSPDAADHFGDEHGSLAIPYLGWTQFVPPEDMIQTIAATTVQVGNGLPRGRRAGVITRWEPGATHGFLVDAEGRSWFVSRDDLPAGHTELPVPTHVTFAGSPSPKPSKRYPQAYSIQLANA